ncbi:hypothetical protein [Acidovorax sp. SUPP2825]|uniref:hypothetical protein n=1 Tax=Acidovorax sp. SUPP2825 TaxID=2920879 RepID=UPI0023DE2353|nr:hypothetical protein [Acidovorax sp. SUPP2825]GKS97227.1 hypothetical protein AVAK2825_21850 [Acidovorax sp. SUPP2825]
MTPPSITWLPLAQAHARWPGGWREALAKAHGTAPPLADASLVCCVEGPLSLPELAWDGTAPWPPGTWADAFALPAGAPAPALLLVQGDLHVAGAVTAPAPGMAAPALVVCGHAHWGHAVLEGMPVVITGDLQVDGLLWGGGADPAEAGATGPGLEVGGSLGAQVALFTGGYGLRTGGEDRVAYPFGAPFGGHDLAAFSAEPLAAVFDPACLHGLAVGEDGRLGALPDRAAVRAALQAGRPVLRSPDAIAADLASDTALCPGGAMHANHLRQLLRSRLLDAAHKKATGWFGQTDFLLCRQHVDDEGDTYGDGLFMTVWKTWDFHLSIDDGTARQGWWQRMTARLRAPPPPPRSDGLAVMHRRYAAGVPGPWEPLAEDGDPAALQACLRAWHGVLDHARRAAAQSRAGHPVWRRLEAALSPARIEALAQLPVFTEQYNDWWGTERNGWWEGDVWVGVRQPCMHQGEPWGLALKLSWRNGTEAPGDAPDDAHAAYQLEIEAAAPGAPPVVRITCAQRQSDPRHPLPRHAVDHAARLLRWFTVLEQRLHAAHGGTAQNRDTA